MWFAQFPGLQTAQFSTGKRRRKRKPKPDYDPEAAARAEQANQGEEGGGYGGLGFFWNYHLLPFSNTL